MNAAYINPPWGHRQVIPLLKSQRIRLTESGMAPGFSLHLHAVPLGASEFGAALRDYPIVFRRREHDGGFEAMAILGMQEGQNLFVMPDGRWDRRTYMPVYVRRYPFCIVDVAGGSGSGDRMVCVDPSAVAPDGERMFDDAGAALPHWTVFERLLHEYQDELARAHRLGATLHEHGVLAPFSLRADLSSGFSLSLDGMYRVDRNKLSTIDAQILRELIAKGEMEWVYAHLMSQENFLRLMARRSFVASRAAA